jgi:hypothetical protein
MENIAGCPSGEELIRGAIALLERHFAAINAGDRAGFRETAYLFAAVDGPPFDIWWRRLRSLAPLSVSLNATSLGDHVSLEKEPHVPIWVHVDAASEATALSYHADLVVWYLLNSQSWKLGCRVHW